MCSFATEAFGRNHLKDLVFFFVFLRDMHTLKLKNSFHYYLSIHP